MLKALAILPLLAAPASAYTYVYQCEMDLGGAVVTDDMPEHMRFEITYEFDQPSGSMVGTMGEVEITLTERDDFTIVTSTAKNPDTSPEHEVTIHTSGSATYQKSTPENAFLWIGDCENMRPLDD